MGDAYRPELGSASAPEPHSGLRPSGAISIAEVIAVIHYADDDQAMRNAETAFDAGCAGVFLIQMEGRDELLPPVAKQIKRRWPGMLVGLNRLLVTPEASLESNLADGLDMTWTDELLTHSDGMGDMESLRLRRLLQSAPDHLLFVGVAFKYQRHEPDPAGAAARAIKLGFVPTTSGAATGRAADVEAVAAMRYAIGADDALAVASGITPDNAQAFAAYASHFLVATGVSSSFHELDATRLRELIAITFSSRDRSAKRRDPQGLDPKDESAISSKTRAQS